MRRAITSPASRGTSALPDTRLVLIGAGAVGALALIGYVVLRRFGPVAVDAVNPLNRENIFATGADAVVGAVTGDDDQTLGGFFHDLFNPRAGMAEGEYSPEPGVIVTTQASARRAPAIGAEAPYTPSFEQLLGEYAAP